MAKSRLAELPSKKAINFKENNEETYEKSWK